MIGIKDAYRILGVSQGASKDEIIKRYDILLKKYRISQQSGSEEEGAGLDEINEAYNLLMGYETKASTPKEPERPNPLYQKLNLDEKKVKNFFYYHKFHIIMSVIALIVLVTSIRGCVTRVIPDLNLIFLGKFYYSDTETLKQKVKQNLPEIKELGVDVITLNPDERSEQAYAMQMKAVAVIAAGDVDVFIVDKAGFEGYGKQGAFMSLDDLSKELEVDREKNKDYIIKSNEDQEAHLYGVDISNSTILKDEKIVGKEKIAAIRINTKNYDKSVKLLKILLK